MTTSIADINHIVSALRHCSSACRELTDFSARNISFAEELKFVKIVNHCASTCDLAIVLIERKSPIVIDFLEVCEEFTLECAMVCSNYSHEIFQQCAAACEQVAKACLPHIVDKSMAS